LPSIGLGTLQAGIAFYPSILIERATAMPVTSGPTEEEIRIRAYHLWKAAGEPGCKMDGFWYRAETELLKERAGSGELPPGMTDNLPV
jgi:Protein of unknown function (DUF2934)